MNKGLLILCLVMLIAPVTYADYIEDISEGASVDWTNGLIRARGVGYASEYFEGTVAEKKLQARQAAKTDAIRKLAEAVNQIRVDGKTTIQQFKAISDTVKTKIKGFVKNCAEKEVTYLTDGRCEVLVEASLTGEGSLSHIVYDNLKVIDVSGTSPEQEKTVDQEQDKDKGRVIVASLEDKGEEDIVTEKYEIEEQKTEDSDQPSKVGVQETESEKQKIEEEQKSEVSEQKIEDVQPEEEKMPVQDEAVEEATVQLAEAESAKVVPEKDIQPEEKSEPEEKKRVLPHFVSGLIVDAQKTSAKPAINPAIISDTGERLYDVTVPDRTFRVKQGLASYTAKVETAEDNRKVTKTPYVIEAMRVVQENPCIIMVSQEEFNEFKRMRGSDIVLDRAKVIIVIGK